MFCKEDSDRGEEEEVERDAEVSRAADLCSSPIATNLDLSHLNSTNTGRLLASQSAGAAMYRYTVIDATSLARMQRQCLLQEAY